MLTVALDVDGVLADFAGGVLRSLEEWHGVKFEPTDITQWDIGKALDVSWDTIRGIILAPSFVSNLKPYPGAVEGVNNLRSVARVVFVTTPWFGSPYWMHERERWLAELFNAKEKDIVQCADKTLVQADLLVDDKPETVLDFEKARRRVILWGQPWDTCCIVNVRMPAGSWDRLLGYVEAL